jgi:glycosyltransferase involved in cell wall biosynthesis
VRRLFESPFFIAGVFLAGLIALGVFVNGATGEVLALAFALVWMGLFRKRRFAVAVSLGCAFVAMAIALACGWTATADALGDGVFGAAIVVLATMRRRAASDALRVLIVSRHDAGRAGGTETYLRSVLRCNDTAERPMQMTLCAFDQGIVHPPYDHATFFVRKGGWFFRYLRADEARFLVNTAWNAFALVMVTLDLALIAITAADEQDVDVVYGVGGLVATFASIAVGIVLAKPVVCHFHYDFFLARHSRTVQRVARTWLMNARFIFANTRGSIEDLLAIGYPADRCAVLLNWVFPEDLNGRPIASLRGAPGEKVMLFLGRLVPEKGIELVLRAFDRTPPGIRLVVAGDGQLHDFVAAWVKMHPNVTWLGEVPPSGVADVLASSDCLVWGSIDRDGYSYAIMEALMAGLPVIASTGSTNMFSRPGEKLRSSLPAEIGVLADPNENAIAAAVVEVCGWDGKAASERCRAYAERFYSPKNFTQLAAALERANAGT